VEAAVAAETRKGQNALGASRTVEVAVAAGARKSRNETRKGQNALDASRTVEVAVAAETRKGQNALNASRTMMAKRPAGPAHEYIRGQPLS
jgi:post-segregation antitoxin (ccd killing protein)